MAQLDAYFDALAVLSLDSLLLGARSYALTAVLVSRRLTQPCSYGLAGGLSVCCRRLVPGMGAVRRRFAIQVILCPLTCFRIAADRCFSSKLQRRYSTELTK